jgi:hypothetical protein
MRAPVRCLVIGRAEPLCPRGGDPREVGERGLQAALPRCPRRGAAGLGQLNGFPREVTMGDR